MNIDICMLIKNTEHKKHTSSALFCFPLGGFDAILEKKVLLHSHFCTSQ